MKKVAGWKRMYLHGAAKLYEASNHLGNVIVTISDKKLGKISNLVQTKAEYYEAIVKTASDYYPFGWQMPNRKLNAENYSFGFNGQIQDVEWNGGQSVHFKFRVHDPRLGRFLSVDPLAPDFPWNSPYAYAENDVIRSRDLEGAEADPTTKPPTCRGGTTNSTGTSSTQKGAVNANRVTDNKVINQTGNSERNNAITHNQTNTNSQKAKGNPNGNNNYKVLDYFKNTVTFLANKTIGATLGLVLSPANSNNERIYGYQNGVLQPLTSPSSGSTNEGTTNEDITPRAGADPEEDNEEDEPEVLFRALRPNDLVTLSTYQGILARCPRCLDVTPLSHVAGKKESPWISTSKDPMIALEKYNTKGYGVVVINFTLIKKMGIPYADVSSNPFDPIKHKRFNAYARKDKEVLIFGQIPQSAIMGYLPNVSP